MCVCVCVFVWGGGGCHDFWSNLFLSYNVEKLLRGNHFASAMFWYQFSLDFSGVFILSKFLCVTVPKNSWGTPVFLKKVWLRRGYHVFRSKYFRIRLPKKFALNHSMFQKKWGDEKFLE